MSQSCKTTIVPPNESCIVQELKIEKSGQYRIDYTVQYEVAPTNLKQIVLNHIRKGIKKGEFTDLRSLSDDLKGEINEPIVLTWIDILVGSNRQAQAIGFENTLSGSWGMWINADDIIRIRLSSSKHHRKVVAMLDVKRIGRRRAYGY